MRKSRVAAAALGVLAFFGARSGAHERPARAPQGIDAEIDAIAPAPAPAAEEGGKITIFTAKKVVTLNRSQPEAQAVAVQGERILAVGTLAEMKEWAAGRPHEVDARFAGAVILPGFVEAHMHPQIDGILWQGVYVGYMDRVAPDGTPAPGCKTKKEVVERLAEAARKAGDANRWVVGWGYQSEYYGASPLTVSDLDPVSNGHPVLVEHASMHIFYANSRTLEIAGITAAEEIEGVMRENGKPTGELAEMNALRRIVPHLPPMDAQLLEKATRDSAALAHRAGVTSIADLSFGTIPGGYKAYKTLAADPDFPVRLVLNPVIDLLDYPEIKQKGGLDYLRELHRHDTNRLKLGPVKFVLDGSIQGYTANLQWPFYYRTQKNGVANMTLADLKQKLLEVHTAGFQAVIHANADQAIEDAIDAIEYVQTQAPRPDARHRIDHTQMVRDSQLRRMAALDIPANLFVSHIYFWGDLHRDAVLGAERAARLNPTATALRHGITFSLHSDASVTPLDPLHTAWVAATRKTMSGRVLGPNERIPVEEALRAYTINAAYLQFEDDIKGTIESGKLADFAVLAENPLEVPVDRVKDIEVLATVVGGKVFPVR